MPLKYQIEKETDVPAEHKGLYHEREVQLPNGTTVKLWVLDVEDVVPRARFTEFRDSNVKLKKENDDLKIKFEGIDDPERARALVKIAKDVEMDDAERFLKKGGVEAMITERVKATKEDLETKLANERKRADSAVSQLDKTVIENAILQACGKMELQQGAEVAILKMADGVWTRKDGKVVSLDHNGNPRSSKDGMNPLGITEWLQEELLKQYPYLIKESQGAGGSGSGSGSRDGGLPNINPFSKKTWNLTMQGQIYQKDPERADRLRKAASMERS